MPQIVHQEIWVQSQCLSESQHRIRLRKKHTLPTKLASLFSTEAEVNASLISFG